MKEKLLYLSFIASILFLGACSDKIAFEDNELPATTGRTLSLTASIPGESATRVSLEEDGKSINLKWQIDDEIQFAIVPQNGTPQKLTTYKLIGTDILNGGKKARFDIVVPETITGQFDLYGVYGGGGIEVTSTNEVRAKLPNRPSMASIQENLLDVTKNKDLMLYFSLPNIQPGSTVGTVQFEHLGSIFAIHLNNTGSNLANVNGLELTGVNNTNPDNTHWAYNSYYPGQSYNLGTNKFLNDYNYGDVPGNLSKTYDNWLHFKATSRFTLTKNSTNVFWAWYPLHQDITWPALRLDIKYTNEQTRKSSANTRKAKTPIAGRTYHFYAKWDGNNLNFTDDSFEIPQIPLSDIPHIYIDTDNGVGVERKDYVKGNVKILGGSKYEDFEARTSIRGRGNTTWDMPKKPYRLKLDEKASLLGLSAEKDWVLLQNYIDPSLMCNAVAMKTGQLLEMPFTNHMIPVNVTLNGVYMGNYTFTENKDVTENRINVVDGWLLEMDTYYDEEYKFYSTNFKLPVMIQYPKLDKMTETEATPIFNEMRSNFNALEQLIYSSTFPNNNYLDYFDDKAFVNYLIVYTLTDNEEINHPKSTYIYKEKGEKYNMGPIWDFDWAFGYEGTRTHFVDPTRNLWWPGRPGKTKGIGTKFFTQITQDPTIKNMYRTEWANFKAQKYPQLVEYIQEYAETIRESHAADQARWRYDTGFNGSIDVYKAQMLDWLDARVAYMDGLYPE